MNRHLQITCLVAAHSFYTRPPATSSIVLGHLALSALLSLVIYQPLLSQLTLFCCPVTCTLNTPGRSLREHYLHINIRVSSRMNDQIKLKLDSLLIRHIHENCLIINENALRSLDYSLSLVVVDGATCVSLFTSNDLILGPLRFHVELMLSDLRSWRSVRF